jgi:hypothetical protein
MPIIGDFNASIKQWIEKNNLVYIPSTSNSLKRFQM